MSNKIKKILIANRGEIAVRIIRACTDMGIKSVAVFSDCDKTAYHVRIADEACHIGPSPSNESYLVQDNIIAAAKTSGADAIHPGYGFLAENAIFAQRCIDEGIIFIGPKPETIALLGDKLQAREAALKANLPVVPGATIDQDNLESAITEAEKVGYPILIKAAAGGGGKGMRVVENADQFEEGLERASSEAKSAFGDGRVFIERFLKRPRHIEIQIMCDAHGNYLHLGERECSIQRRHQKVIEESPSPIMTPKLRQRMGDAAVNIASQTGYIGAGTVEFMVSQNMEFFFLEVNTRLQVEHPVTELVTGIDIVKEQIAIAENKPISFTQDDVTMTGHAIECRIYAEDPQNGFVPSTGILKNYRIPAGPGVRVDSGVVLHNEIPIYYDPMIAKLCTWGQDRTEAIARMLRALREYRLAGLLTTIGFHQTVLKNQKFIDGDISTSFLAEEYPDNNYTELSDRLARSAAIAAALDKFTKERKIASMSESQQGEQSKWKKTHRRAHLRGYGGTD